MNGIEENLSYLLVHVMNFKTGNPPKRNWWQEVFTGSNHDITTSTGETHHGRITRLDRHLVETQKRRRQLSNILWGDTPVLTSNPLSSVISSSSIVPVNPMKKYIEHVNPGWIRVRVYMVKVTYYLRKARVDWNDIWVQRTVEPPGTDSQVTDDSGSPSGFRQRVFHWSISICYRSETRF